MIFLRLKKKIAHSLSPGALFWGALGALTFPMTQSSLLQDLVWSLNPQDLFSNHYLSLSELPHKWLLEAEMFLNQNSPRGGGEGKLPDPSITYLFYSLGWLP